MNKFVVGFGMVVFIFSLFTPSLLQAASGIGQEVESETSSSVDWGMLGEMANEVQRGFGTHIEVLTFGTYQDVRDSELNRNNFLAIPQYTAESQGRLNFRLNFQRLELGVKPIVELRWKEVESGQQTVDDSVVQRSFLNEWIARYRLSDQLFVSYGRENLQWGPSFLLSPSNPFITRNGQNNPRFLIPGLDYGRVIWIPSLEWSLTFIANTDQGRDMLIRDFKNVYVLKLDYTSEGKTFSLIPSTRQDDTINVGYFGFWTVSDALLLWGEGNFEGTIEDSDVLVGGSYTLESGPTLAIEYYRNGNGCTIDRIVLCFIPGFGETEPSDGFFFRKNFFMVQYLDVDIMDDTDLAVRWIRNFDDDSNRIIAIVDYELGNHAVLFYNGTFDTGGQDAVFGSLVKQSSWFGVSYIF